MTFDFNRFIGPNVFNSWPKLKAETFVGLLLVTNVRMRLNTKSLSGNGCLCTLCRIKYSLSSFMNLFVPTEVVWQEKVSFQKIFPCTSLIDFVASNSVDPDAKRGTAVDCECNILFDKAFCAPT